MTMPIPFIIFVGCFFLYAAIIGSFNQLTFFLTFFLVLYLIAIAVRAIARKFRFVNVGQLQLMGNELSLSRIGKKMMINESAKVGLGF